MTAGKGPSAGNGGSGAAGARGRKRCLQGAVYGAVGQTLGEAVFCTAMTGYQETLTDPSSHRQIVVATAPQIGNTGAGTTRIDEDRATTASGSRAMPQA